MLYYIPLELIDSRYTNHFDRDINYFLSCHNIEHKRIYPTLTPEKRVIKAGSFLDAPTTIEFKSKQISEIAKLFYDEEINDGDEFFFSDIWFPGVESLAYLKYFCKKKIKLKGVLHAGSFTDTDFVRDMERWAKNFEEIIFDIFDEIYVASEFIKNDVIQKRMVDPNKIIVTPFKIDNEVKKFQQKERENIVIFNGRNVDEKQPWLFEKLEKKILKKFDGKVRFVNTQRAALQKDEYYELIGKAKVVVSFALQENFGFGVNEAVHAGCVPILPERLVYPEFYERKYLYEDFKDCVEKVLFVLENNPPAPRLPEKTIGHYSHSVWFNTPFI